MPANPVDVVLVHGAWADGSSWGKVIGALEADGFNAVAAPLPLTSLADDVAALDQTLERVEGPVVLAGHAYAGAVIGATRDPKVASLVYIAALAPEQGESAGDVFNRGQPDPKKPSLEPDSHGLVWLPESAFADAFAPNASPEEQAVLAAVQRPISVHAVSAPVGRPLWKDRPSWYLIAEEDNMIGADTERFMAVRMGARARSLPVDHTPLITAPQDVADIIRDAVSDVAKPA
jgi:pimeloyl-ACP methyl ester carboxylesterase